MLVFACTYTQKIKDGQTAFERKQYKVAVGFLNKEYQKAKTRVEKGKLAFLIGESYKNMNQPEASIEWYQIAYDNQYGVDALKEYAYALKQNQQYEEAKDAFKNLGIEIGSPYEYRKEIVACNVALGWLNEKVKTYEVSGVDFNSGSADYSPTLYKDNQLVFTSDRSSATGDEKYKWTGNDFSDLYLVDLESNSVKPFDNQFNSPSHEGTTAFSADYSEVFFTRCFGSKNEDQYCKLMVSKMEGGIWSKPQVLSFVKDQVNYGHPSLSEDGSTLYFSNDDEDGWGGYDIYYVERTPAGWDEPVLMSRSINTTGNETFPYIHQDTLYFASDAHTGMGGLDIFRTYKLTSNTWTPVYNLKAPINSGSDDFAYVIDKEAPKKGKVLEQGYFSSTRENGTGGDDIYRYERRPLPPPPPVAENEEPKEIVYKIILNGYVLEKIYADPTNPDSKVLGRKPLKGATVQANFGKQTKKFTVGEDGLFSLELDRETDYNFFASRENYLNDEARFSTKGIGKDPKNPVLTFEIEIVLEQIFENREIVLEDIYYDFDQWFIRDDAKPTLDELTRALQLNPDRKIQLSSHTDCRGNDNYNRGLSQKRAQSAVDYLIGKGIDASRLTAVGYGENQLRVECVCTRCSEEEHQINRRTTFKFIE